MNMSDFTAEEVLQLAQLSRIRLEPEEVESLRADLSGIRSHVELIQAVDTSETTGTILSNGVECVERPDQVQNFDEQQIMQRVPNSQDNYIKVPKVL